MANLTAICGFSQFGVPIIPGNGSSPCNREISIYVDPLGGVPALGSSRGDRRFSRHSLAQGLIQCTTPAPGNAACITPAAVAPLGIDVTNSGPIGPLQVVFVNQPGYRPPIAQQASFGIEREIGPGFSISLSGIYSHTQRLPVAIDTNLLPAPFTHANSGQWPDCFLSQLEYDGRGSRSAGRHGAGGLPCDNPATNAL